MKWKDFFMITNQKLKITGLLFVLYYVDINLSNILIGAILPDFARAFNDVPQATEQLGSFMIINLLSLIIVSYIFSCIITSIFPKRGRK